MPPLPRSVTRDQDPGALLRASGTGMLPGGMKRGGWGRPLPSPGCGDTERVALGQQVQKICPSFGWQRRCLASFENQGEEMWWPRLTSQDVSPSPCFLLFCYPPGPPAPSTEVVTPCPRAASPCQSQARAQASGSQSGLLLLALAASLSSGASCVSRLGNMSYFGPVALSRGDFTLQGHLAVSGDVCGCRNWRSSWNLAGGGQGCC